MDANQHESRRFEDRQWISIFFYTYGYLYLSSLISYNSMQKYSTHFDQKRFWREIFKATFQKKSFFIYWYFNLSYYTRRFYYEVKGIKLQLIFMRRSQDFIISPQEIVYWPTGINCAKFIENYNISIWMKLCDIPLITYLSQYGSCTTRMMCAHLNCSIETKFVISRKYQISSRNFLVLNILKLAKPINIRLEHDVF